MIRVRLGELLVRAGLVSEEDVRATLLAREPVPLGAALVRRGLLSEADLVRALSLQLDCPLVDIDHVDPEPAALAKLTPETAGRLQWVPFKLEGRRLHVAVTDPSNEDARSELSVAQKLEVRLYLAPPLALERALARHYGPAASRPVVTPEMMARRIRDLEEEIADLRFTAAAGQLPRP